MKVLIAGCGYVGLALGSELVRQGHTVWGVRRGSAGNDDLRAAGIRPLEADITRRETFDSLPAGCDWVVNCASASGAGAEEYRRVYLEGTQNLLEWLAGAPPGKFVYTSSTGVYSQIDGSTVDERTPVPPGAGTAQVLIKAEQILLEAARDTGFPSVILRSAGIYGPERGYWLKQFLSGAAVIEGNGERRLNMIHRDDLVGAIISALERGQPGEVYNAVDDQPPTQLEVFEWLSQRLGRDLPGSVPPNPDASRRRGVTNKIVSNRRLRTELGWEPKYPSFRQGYEVELKRMGLV